MADESAPPLPARGLATLPKRSVFWTLGALYGASAVCFRDFGAHGPKKGHRGPGQGRELPDGGALPGKSLFPPIPQFPSM
ncbi:hypothetical protein DL769_011478 [Monosporascus sp. CRB-8-3]|nr:hypothetical protein DL769_011478 [Monosporascus sp. CRB-8-3]